MDKHITVRWEADGQWQPFLGRLIGSTVSWTAGLDSGTATISDCRVTGFDAHGLASYEIYLAVQSS